MEHFIAEQGSINSGPDIPNPIFSLFPLTVTCLHLLKDIAIMEFVMLWSVLPNLTFSDVDSCKNIN